jgi:PilZ domain
VWQAASPAPARHRKSVHPANVDHGFADFSSVEKTTPQSAPIPASQPGERRNSARYLFSAPVLLLRLDHDPPLDTYGISLELSEGGMSALVNDALQLGEHVRVRLRLPAGDFETIATVIHRTRRHYGLAFEPLDAQHIQRIRESSARMLAYCSRVSAPGKQTDRS